MITDYILDLSYVGHIPLRYYALLPPQWPSCLCLRVTTLLSWASIEPTLKAFVLHGPLLSPAKTHEAISSFAWIPWLHLLLVPAAPSLAFAVS